MFFRVDNDGLCESCHTQVLPVLERHCKIVVECGRLIDSSKNSATRLSRIQIALSSLEQVSEFERKGIHGLTRPTREIVSTLRDIESEIVDSEVHDAAYQAKMAAEDGRTEAQKLAGFNRSIKKLDKLMADVHDVSIVEAAIERLRVERDNFSARLEIEKAELLIAQSRRKRAKDVLIEALHGIEKDVVDDSEQRHLIDEIQELLSRIQD